MMQKMFLPLFIDFIDFIVGYCCNFIQPPNKIKSGKFNGTTLKLSEKLDHPFSHIIKFDTIFAQGHGDGHQL